jgi:hypothetical protein
MFGPSTPAATTGAEANNGLPDGIFDANDWNAPGAEIWYLPPGAAFFNNVGEGAVSMTAEGVNVGGIDLLDFMAMDDPNHGYNVMDGNGF